MNQLHRTRDKYGDSHYFFHMQRRPYLLKVYQHYVPRWVDYLLIAVIVASAAFSIA